MGRELNLHVRMGAREDFSQVGGVLCVRLTRHLFRPNLCTHYFPKYINTRHRHTFGTEEVCAYNAIGYVTCIRVIGTFAIGRQNR